MVMLKDSLASILPIETLGTLLHDCSYSLDHEVTLRMVKRKL